MGSSETKNLVLSISIELCIEIWTYNYSLLYDRIFITTHKYGYCTFCLYIYVIMDLLRKVLKKFKKGKNTGFGCKT